MQLVFHKEIFPMDESPNIYVFPKFLDRYFPPQKYGGQGYSYALDWLYKDLGDGEYTEELK